MRFTHMPPQFTMRSRSLASSPPDFDMALVAAFVAFAYPAHAAGTSYYVDTSGANSNDGSSGSPLATLQEAVNRASPGDTITVRACTYTVSEPVTVTNKQGTSSAVLTIRGEGMPVFRGASVESIPVFGGLIAIDSSAYVTVTGIWLENSGWFSFKASNSSNIVFDNNQSSVSLASAIMLLTAMQ